MTSRLVLNTRLLNNLSNVRYFHISSALQKLTQFVLSDIGEGIREVTVRDWFVNVGDQVSQFDNICLVESDKASVNITSRYDGIVKHLHYTVGETALVGKPLVDIETADSDQDSSIFQNEVNKIDKKESIKLPDESISDEKFFTNKKLATPAVRRIAAEHNVVLKDINGTGKSGRILKEDILSYINRKPEQTATYFNSNNEKIVPIAGIKKVMVQTMTRSHQIPTFGYYDEIDVTKLVALRDSIKDYAKNHGTTITYMPFFVKALSSCIKSCPEINSSIDDNVENIIIKDYHNIGIAVDTPKGLVVPNIKNVQDLSFTQINKELIKLMEKGRDGKLLPDDMNKGTISISNIGAIGGTYAKPLINPPEVCILAIGKFRVVPLLTDDNKIIRTYVCSLSWTADHRIIDGASMARFSNRFKDYLENPTTLLIDF